MEATGTDTNGIFKWIIKFIKEIQKKYGVIEGIFPDCAEQVLNNSLRKELIKNGLLIPVADSVKTPIEDRIRLIMVLLNTDNISFIKDKTNTVIEALQTALYDENADTERWLDDFSSDIDTIDAFCYSWTKWSTQLARYMEG
jgi:hypothetical protein